MFFNKKKTEEPVQPQAPVVKAEEPVKEEEKKPEPKKLTPADTTIIGKGIVFYGDFTGDDPIVINGSIKGDIATTSSLTISEDGTYTGNAQVADLESNGRIKGNINCENLSVLGEKSAMKGHLVTSYLTSKTGSTFIGQLDMTNPQTPEDSEEEDAEPAPVFASAPAASKKYEPVEFDWNPEATARRNAQKAEEEAREAARKAAEEAENAAKEAAEDLEEDLITVDGLLNEKAEGAEELAEGVMENAADAAEDLEGAVREAAEGLEEDAEGSYKAMKAEFDAAVEKHGARNAAPSGPNPFADLDKNLTGDIKIPDIFAMPEDHKE